MYTTGATDADNPVCPGAPYNVPAIAKVVFPTWPVVFNIKPVIDPASLLL